MTLDDANRFAEHRVAAWNSHDIDSVLAHYTDDVELTKPMIQQVLGVSSGTLKGKKAIGDYWRAALQKIPDLKFSIIDVTVGVGAVSVYYDAVMGKKAVETFFFNDQAKVYKSLVTYN